MIDITDIYNYLDSHNIKYSNRGFQYLVTAIRLCIKDRKYCTQMTDLYAKIAQIYEATESKAERSIRYVLAEQSLTNKKFIIKAVYDLLTIDQKLTTSNETHNEDGKILKT